MITIDVPNLTKASLLAISKVYQELKVAVIVNDGMVAGIELEDESEYLN